MTTPEVPVGIRRKRLGNAGGVASALPTPNTSTRISSAHAR